MSAIFPTAPAKVNLHHIPSNADFITYGIQNENIILKAWMPSGLFKVEYKESKSRLLNNFYDNHCRNCVFNDLQHYVNNYSEYLDEYLYVKDPSLYEKTCGVYYKGFIGQPCNKGHIFEKNPGNNLIEVQNMVFQINLTYLGDIPRFQKTGDNAHLCAGYEENGNIYKTREYSAPNVYSGTHHNYYNGHICWGSTNYNRGADENEGLNSLRGITTMFFQSRTNNDLLPINRFKNFNENLFDLKGNDDHYSKSIYDKFLCSGYDSLMLIDADQDVQAFFTMIMAGFRPIPEAPHVMMIPLKNCTIERNGNVYFGFSTQEDSVGRCWYVSSEGYLIGQLDESYTYA
jgi:hypothetical protein